MSWNSSVDVSKEIPIEDLIKTINEQIEDSGCKFIAVQLEDYNAENDFIETLENQDIEIEFTLDLDDIKDDVIDYAKDNSDLIDPDDYECPECEEREGIIKDNLTDKDNFIRIFGETIELNNRLNITHFYKLKEFVEQNELD